MTCTEPTSFPYISPTLENKAATIDISIITKSGNNVKILAQ